MQYYRCKCGNRQFWSSGGEPYPCQGCESCNTTFSQTKRGHKPLVPHDLVLMYHRDTGEPYRKRCLVCHGIFPLEKE